MGYTPSRETQETYVPCGIISSGFGDWNAIEFTSNFPRSGVYYNPSSQTHRLWVKNSDIRTKDGKTSVRARISSPGRIKIFDSARQRNAEFGQNQ